MGGDVVTGRSGAIDPVCDGERPAWSVRLLGGFEVTRLGRRLPPPTGVPLEAVKFLATCGPLHVEEVAEALWPEVRPETGRRRLRNVLLRVRDAYGPLVERSDEVLDLARDTEVDARRFCAEAEAALLRPREDPAGVPHAWNALRWHGGELLPADRFREWTQQPRQRVGDLLLGVLDRLTQHTIAADRPDEAIWLLQYAIQHDPWAEDRYLTAARLLHDHGLHGRAATMLARARTVTAELGLPPPQPPWASTWNLAATSPAPRA